MEIFVYPDLNYVMASLTVMMVKMRMMISVVPGPAYMVLDVRLATLV